MDPIPFEKSNVEVIFGAKLIITIEYKTKNNNSASLRIEYEYDEKIPLLDKKPPILVLSIKVNNDDYPKLVKEFICTIPHKYLELEFNYYINLNLSDLPSTVFTLSVTDYHGCMPIKYLHDLIELLKNKKIESELEFKYPKNLLMVEYFKNFEGIIVRMESNKFDMINSYFIRRSVRQVVVK